MKYLYVLASTDKDYYAEQAFVSITSLRIHNENAFVSLLVDDKTNKNLDQRKFNIKSLVNEIVVKTFDENIEQRDRSRQLKTSMRNLVSGDFLYIDCDTVICDNLEEIWNCDYNLAAVPDGHMEFKDLRTRQSVISKFKKVSKNNIPIEKYYFNGGVLFVKECRENSDFFYKWNEYWNSFEDEKSFGDQISLAFANAYFKFPISELNGIWNCQVENGLNYLSKAKILHYFATTKFEYGNFSKNLPLSLKGNGTLTEENLYEIKSPKHGYPTPHWVISGNDYTVFTSESFYAFSKRPKLFSPFEKIFSILKKTIKTLLLSMNYIKQSILFYNYKKEKENYL